MVVVVAVVVGADDDDDGDGDGSSLIFLLPSSMVVVALASPVLVGYEKELSRP